jgi:hypothetical protein
MYKYLKSVNLYAHANIPLFVDLDKGEEYNKLSKNDGKEE